MGDDHWWRELETSDYRGRAQLQKGGPVYRVRFRHGKAYFDRRRDDGTLELLAFPHDHPIYIGDPDESPGARRSVRATGGADQGRPRPPGGVLRRIGVLYEEP